MTDYKEPTSSSKIDLAIQSAEEVLECVPEGEVEILTISKETSEQHWDEITKFYHAVFGSEPWGVLLDEKNNYIPWECITEENRNNLHEDPKYTKSAIKETIKEWFEKDGSNLFYSTDQKGNVFSFGAIFRHEDMETLIEQIREDNGYLKEDVFLKDLKEKFVENSSGELIYIADLATHPKIRSDLNFTTRNWLSMFSKIIDLSERKALTVTLRTSSKVGAPLKGILDKMFRSPGPVYEEDGEIVYYALRFNSDVVTSVKEKIETGDFRGAMAGIISPFRS